jgi:glycosyltransferase involved in cell wall biosynthesis
LFDVSVQPVVSVVVAARNGAHQLPLLFEALAGQTLPREDFEVVVVDDGSDDGTEALVEASGIARVIRCAAPVGLPRARNIGIEAARGRFVALTDADTVPDLTWLEHGVRRLEERDADILGGGVSIALGERPSLAALVDAMNWLNQEACVAQGFPVGANIWARRETFERWGAFSESIEAYGHDDAEWGQRATNGGAKLVYAPEVHLTHPPRSKMAEVRRKAYKLGFGLAPHRRLEIGTIRELPPLFLRPTPFLPPRRISLERLVELGQRPKPARILQLYVAQWLFVMLPKIAGDFMGELKYARARRRRLA